MVCVYGAMATIAAILVVRRTTRLTRSKKVCYANCSATTWCLATTTLLTALNAKRHGTCVKGLFMSKLGSVAEWSKAFDLKSNVPKGTRGSNPFASAIRTVFLWVNAEKLLLEIATKNFEAEKARTGSDFVAGVKKKSSLLEELSAQMSVFTNGDFVQMLDI